MINMSKGGQQSVEEEKLPEANMGSNPNSNTCKLFNFPKLEIPQLSNQDNNIYLKVVV